MRGEKRGPMKVKIRLQVIEHSTTKTGRILTFMFARSVSYSLADPWQAYRVSYVLDADLSDLARPLPLAAAMVSPPF